MEVKIYQIKNFEDCKYSFMGWRHAQKYFNIKDYEEVYSYLLVSNPSKENDYRVIMSKDEKLGILNKIYEKFNIAHPEDFKGHSLSMSDVVALGDELYYCDSFGWEKTNG